MTYTQLINGERVSLSAEEIAEIEARKAEWEAGADDRAAAEVREKRDTLLAETDWWVLPDRTATDQQLAYRQALRDITGQDGFPNNITWPEKP